MPRYHCYGVVTGGKYLGVVEAADEDEARDKAMELKSAYVWLCHQCSHECEDPQIEEVNVQLTRDEVVGPDSHQRGEV